MKNIVIGIVVIALIAAGLYVASRRGITDTTGSQATATSEPTLVAQAEVTAEGTLLPAQHAVLSFATGGAVAEVLVRVSDVVTAGQVLARLESGRARANVAQAQASLVEAQARFEQIKTGATPEERSAAEAALAQAQAQQRQTTGSVTSADIRAAEATLTQAQAQLTRLLAGPKNPDRRAAEAALAQAQAQAQTQRDQLSAAKTNAKLSMDQAVDALTQAQSTYVTAKANWEHARDDNTDPFNTAIQLNEAQRQHYYDSAVQAESALHRAEDAVAQAQVAFNAARYNEETGVRAAEQQVASAQAALDKLVAGAEADQVAAARAAVANAQATLTKLRGDQRNGTLDAAQAAVDQAQAQLAHLQAGATASALAVATAQVQNAQAALELAQVGLSETELRAPFDGSVAGIDVDVGDYVAPGMPAAQVADTTSWQVETTDLTELNVAALKIGDAATLTFDAIPGLSLPAKITQIAGYGKNRQGDVVYTVTVVPDQTDARLRWNMTATVTITPES